MWVWSPSIREMEGFESLASLIPALGMVDINEPVQAEKLVAKFAGQGYDGIKVKFVDSVEIYNAILESAKKHNIKVDGHIPEDLWFGENKEIFICEDQKVCWDVFINMDIEAVAHIEETLRCADRTTDEGILQAAQDIVDDGMWVTTTTYLLRSIEEQIADLESLLNKPEVDYLNPAHFRMGWLPGENTYSQLDPSYFSKRYVAPHERMLFTLNELGALLISGTDTPLPIMVPGFSLHGELAAMADIGLSPYDVLKTSTYNPAKYLDKLDEFGTIEVGKRADLVLLRANPMEDITNTQQIEGVMARGKWFNRTDLNNILDEVLKANKG
jgi:imidazolonepropionase-like amidohydrolase